jgi:hypothetical protein
MIPVRCRTNLDLSHEQWPSELPCLPNVGDEIESAIEYNGFRLSLEVVSIRWVYERDFSYANEYKIKDTWIPEIELHMTKWQQKLYSRNAHQGSIAAFYEWYAPKVGKSVSAFI